MEGIIKNLQAKPRNIPAVRILPSLPADGPPDPEPLIFCESPKENNDCNMLH